MMNSELRIEVLGSFQVKVSGQPTRFRTDAQRVLLAYLAAHRAVPQRRDTLAGLLSPDRPDKEALVYLSNRLGRLRKTLKNKEAKPPWLTVDRKQITLRAGGDIEIDLVRFERLLAAVEAHAHRQLAGCPVCMERLQEAVALVRGELLAGLNFPSETWEAWLLAKREEVQQRSLEAMTLLRDARLERGEWAETLEIATRQLAYEPWLESAHRAVMLAHYRLGDRTAALAQYEACEKLLYEEFDVDPEPETLELHQQILDDVAIVASGIPDNLPLQTGGFFGRTPEKTRLLTMLVDPAYRLITLVGAGGMGKTRLSLEVGRQVKESFPDGVWFVPLDAVKGGAEQIKIAVGEAIGLSQDDRQLTGDQVIAILREKRMLIIFDNSEPVLDEIAFIPDWLRRAPGIVILATSREPLNFSAESILTLDGLPLENAEQLFAERGRMARDGFAVSAENRPHIQRICELVDGSPLGIALAAAWVRRRSLTQIIDSIGQSLDFLSTRMRDVTPRHRSMRAVFETSWQFLEREEQEILAALSVFPVTFSAEAARQIAAATLFDLDVLCEKSLLQQDQESERYAMHGLVRQYSAEKLADRTSAVNRAFLDYFYQFAHTHQQNYAGLQPEWHNFTTAIERTYTQQAWRQLLDFVSVLDEARFRQVRFVEMQQGLRWAIDAADALGDDAMSLWSLLRLGEVEVEVNAYDSAEKHLTLALNRYMRQENDTGIANAYYLLGRIKIEQAQNDEALQRFDTAGRIFLDNDQPLEVAKTLNQIALCHMTQKHDFKTAQANLERSVEMQRKLPLTWRYIEALRHLARVHSYFGNFAAADQHLTEAIKESRTQHNLGEYAAALFERVILCRRQDQFAEALAWGRDCLQAFQQLGSLRWEGLIKAQLALVHQKLQHPDQALVYFKDSLQIFIELGDLYEQAYGHYHLFLLHREMNNPAKSELARQNALQLNATLRDPALQERLA